MHEKNKSIQNLGELVTIHFRIFFYPICYLEDGVQFVLLQPLFLFIFLSHLSKGGVLSGSVPESIEIDCYSDDYLNDITSPLTNHSGCVV
jgi:hypothetical protein